MRVFQAKTLFLLASAAVLLARTEQAAGSGLVQPSGNRIEHAAHLASEPVPALSSSIEEESASAFLLTPTAAIALPQAMESLPPGSERRGPSAAVCGTLKVRGPPHSA
jgi:hypothetical protein